jgi:hypothetical protein
MSAAFNGNKITWNNNDKLYYIDSISIDYTCDVVILTFFFFQLQE